MSVRYRGDFETRISYEAEALSRLHQANMLEELGGTYPERIPQFYSSVSTLYRYLTEDLRRKARSPDEMLEALLDEKERTGGPSNRQRIQRLRRDSQRQRHPLRRGELDDTATSLEMELRREAASRSKEKIIDTLNAAGMLIHESGIQTVTPTEKLTQLTRPPEHKFFPKGIPQDSGVKP